MRWPDIRSYGRCSNNEHGLKEVNAEFNRTIFQWLFRKPNTIKEWVAIGKVWYNKEDMSFASDKDVELIEEINYRLDHTNRLFERA